MFHFFVYVRIWIRYGKCFLDTEVPYFTLMDILPAGHDENQIRFK